jgi:hypothetical protein
MATLDPELSTLLVKAAYSRIILNALFSLRITGATSREFSWPD